MSAVPQRLLENKLYVKVKKCEFHATAVSFLGFVISTGGIQMDPDKTKPVMDWPVLESCKQLHFLGFALCFIQDYSKW